MDEQYYTVDEVAKVLRVSASTVRRLLRAHKMRGARVGRRILIRRQDIEEYFRQYPAYPEES